MLRAVHDVLEEIGAGENPRLLVGNKADLLDAEQRREFLLGHPDAVLVSAQTGEGLDALGERVEETFRATLRSVELLLPYREGGRLAELHELAGDLQREDTPEGVRVTALLPGPRGRALRALRGAQRRRAVAAGALAGVQAAAASSLRDRPARLIRAARECPVTSPRFPGNLRVRGSLGSGGSRDARWQ